MGSINTILQAPNQHRIAKANYDAARITQSANNSREAARIALADFSRSLSNTMRVEAAGKEYNEASSQLAGTLEARGMGKINSSLAAAERMGAIAAQAGAMGVGGSSTELLSSTIKLQRNIEQDLADSATTRMAKQGSRSNAQIMDNGYSGTSMARESGSFDYTVHIAPKPMKNRLGALIGASVATFFGGPQAGAMVADMAVGSWQNANGNFQGASQSYDSGVARGVEGYKTWASLQGGEGPKTWFGAVTQKRNEESDSTGGNKVAWGSFKPGEDTLFGSGFGWG